MDLNSVHSNCSSSLYSEVNKDIEKDKNKNNTNGTGDNTQKEEKDKTLIKHFNNRRVSNSITTSMNTNSYLNLNSSTNTSTALSKTTHNMIYCDDLVSHFVRTDVSPCQKLFTIPNGT